MARPSRFSPEVRERAVMVFEHAQEHASQWAAITSIAEKIGRARRRWRSGRTIATTAGVERIHLVAHSRGTDILATAMSDLTYEAYTQQSHVARRYKIGNIVLIAPDIDADVAIAKIFKAVSDPDLPYGPAPNPRMVFERIPGFQITVYVSPNDKALAASSWLFGSIGRLGKLDVDKLTPEQIEYARRVGFIDVIQVRDTAGWVGHSYFTSDPRVSAVRRRAQLHVFARWSECPACRFVLTKHVVDFEHRRPRAPAYACCPY
jgi:alpha/beta hydrolase family protein DUF900